MNYVAQSNDIVKSTGRYKSLVLVRDGRQIGTLAGRDRAVLHTFDTFTGKRMDTRWLESPLHYLLQSPDDAEFEKAQHPVKVYRKSKPTDLARIGYWKFDAPVVHTIYLEFNQKIKGGRTYALSFKGKSFPTLRFKHDPFIKRSESVHINHLGFHPDDPVKRGYLSIWLGDGGRHKLDPLGEFHVIDSNADRTVIKDVISQSKSATQRDEDAYGRNYNGTDIYSFDFTGLDQPGAYRIYVDGIGCSYPFSIGTQVWRDAFIVAARGLYHQRSGIAIGPPYTTYERPRAFHPDDGIKVFQSQCSLMDSANGLNRLGADSDKFGNLLKQATTQIVTNAWGGYCDAGDWDRRIQHLGATRLLLELYDLFPDTMRHVVFDIPESGNDLPDLIDESLWNIDFFRRLQIPEGGIRGGIESAEHPRVGEGSWQESLPVMAYAPDVWSSYVYAGVTARLAGILRESRLSEENTYHESALRAMIWAEKEYKKLARSPLPHAVNDARNLAAVELFDINGARRWHEVFMRTTVFTRSDSELAELNQHEQRDAAFVYCRTRQQAIDPDVQRNANQAFIREANGSVAISESTAFGWTKLNPWEPVGWGNLTTPQVQTLVRAHVLTGDDLYLRAIVLACQTGLGANPVNICYTTGLGHDWPRHPLIVDARVLGSPPPPGITVFGPSDMERNADYFGFTLIKRFLYPPAKDWPTLEAFFDTYLSPQTCEFTIHETLGPTIYAWGYLTACPRKKVASGVIKPAVDLQDLDGLDSVLKEQLQNQGDQSDFRNRNRSP
jgi:endoglucanase